MLGESAVRSAFPGVDDIGDRRLRGLVTELWAYVSERNDLWERVEDIPLHPAMPAEKHGNLVAHILAMVRLAEALVPVYRELWQHDLSLDSFRTAAYVHDAAKVIEFIERDGAIVATPGYNHAVEAGRIVRALGGPEDVAHMVEAHSFAGPLVVPRTRDAQLFLFLDPICLNVFPEQGPSAVERHLAANGWNDPRTLERYPAG